MPSARVRHDLTAVLGLLTAAVCVARYRSSGWGDGLEVSAFLHPLLLTVLAGGLVAVVRRRG